MSYSLGDLKEIIRQVIREESKPRTPVTPTEDAVQHISECPDCFSKALKKMNETSEYKCDHCGLPLGNENFVKKLVKCPNCGRKEPRKR